MTWHDQILYSPALRFKTGELEGIRELAPDVANCVLPRFIIPPRGDRDDAPQLPLQDEPCPDVGVRLAAHWQDRPLLLECSYILDEFGREQMPMWLSRMFGEARKRRAKVVPAAKLMDLGASEVRGFRSVLDQETGLAFALVLASSDLADNAVLSNISRALDGLGVSPRECAVVLDFSDADLSSPEMVEPIVRYGVELVQELGRWRRIVFQGTGFPEKNPAEDGGHHMVRRTEWLAWNRVIAADPSMFNDLTFGDYAADCAKMLAKKGGRAIPHLRYTCNETWLVQRGRKLTGSHKVVMGAVCRAIMSSGHFSGAGFSSADTGIAALAAGVGGAGTAATWRSFNTTHHITAVISALAKMRGGSIKIGPVPASQLQFAV